MPKEHLSIFDMSAVCMPILASSALAETDPGFITLPSNAEAASA